MNGDRVLALFLKSLTFKYKSGSCYPSRTSGLVDKALLKLHNSSYHAYPCSGGPFWKHLGWSKTVLNGFVANYQK